MQKPTIEEQVRSSGENRLDIQSILTISAVDPTDTGNISCIGTNEAGVNSSTTYLHVVGKSIETTTELKTILKSLEHLSDRSQRHLWFFWLDKPYIRLLPQLSPKLAHQDPLVEVKEGEDLQLSVLIEAYPHITEHRWHTPTSPNTSTREQKFVRYNNRYKSPEIMKSKQISGGKIWMWKCCLSILDTFDTKHRGHDISLGHQTVRGKISVLFLA